METKQKYSKAKSSFHIVLEIISGAKIYDSTLDPLIHKPGVANNISLVLCQKQASRAGANN